MGSLPPSLSVSCSFTMGSSIAFAIRSVDRSVVHSLSIRLMVSLRIKHLANEPFSSHAIECSTLIVY